MKIVTPDSFASEVANMVQEYSEEIMEEMADEVKKEAKAFVAEIPSTTAFKDTSYHKTHLRNSFVATATVNEKNYKEYVIHAVNGKYRIVHLVENGHDLASKKRGVYGSVPAHHFLVPLALKYDRLIAENIEEIIKKGK